MTKEKLFEFFDADRIMLTVRDVGSGNPSECSQCEEVLDDFAESDKEKAGIWYHGNNNMADVAASLRKFAVEKGYHISILVAATEDGKEAILLNRLNEAEFMEMQKKKS